MAPVVPSPIERLPNPLAILSHRTPPSPNFFLRASLQKPTHPPLSTRPLDPTARPINGAYATFISKDDYLPGALVLAYCHHMSRSIYPFIILATPSLSQNARTIIKKVGITLIDIEPLVPAREQYDPSVTDTRFRETWTKLRSVEPLTPVPPSTLLMPSPRFAESSSKHNTRCVSTTPPGSIY